jgi:hypothetical protein
LTSSVSVAAGIERIAAFESVGYEMRGGGAAVLRTQQLRLWKFDSEITLRCKSLKSQGKFRGWVFGTISATGVIRAA